MYARIGPVPNGYFFDKLKKNTISLMTAHSGTLKEIILFISLKIMKEKREKQGVTYQEMGESLCHVKMKS